MNSVQVIGAGKVGTVLAQALRGRGQAVHVQSWRAGVQPITAQTVLLAVRDSQLAEAVGVLQGHGMLPPDAIVLHLAGAWGPEVLEPLRKRCAGVGQMHPMLSFGDINYPPKLEGAHVLVAGDEPAMARAEQLAQTLGMVPRRLAVRDRVAYHAAAGLLAGGAMALAAASRQLLTGAGIDERTALAMLGPLLHSVADNLQALGVPQALSGVVRRGDATTLNAHLQALHKHAPEYRALYIASSRVQLQMAKALGEAGDAGLERIAQLLDADEKYS